MCLKRLRLYESMRIPRGRELPNFVVIFIRSGPMKVRYSPILIKIPFDLMMENFSSRLIDLIEEVVGPFESNSRIIGNLKDLSGC